MYGDRETLGNSTLVDEYGAFDSYFDEPRDSE